MNRNIIFLLIALLCACTTPVFTTENSEQKETFIQSMDKWIGRSADDLVAANGAPANVYQQESGGRILEYVRILTLSETDAEKLHAYTSYNPRTQEHIYVPDTRPRTSSGMGRYVLGAGKSCKLLFNVSAGNIVDSWSIGQGTCY